MSIIAELQRAQSEDPRFDGEGNVVRVTLTNGDTWTGVVYVKTDGLSDLPLPHSGDTLRLEKAVRHAYTRLDPVETLFIAIGHIVSAHIVWN